MDLKINDIVERIGSKSDYCTGRIGMVIDVSDQRSRVLWTKTKLGTPMNLRTYVKNEFLKKIN